MEQSKGNRVNGGDLARNTIGQDIHRSEGAMIASMRRTVQGSRTELDETSSQLEHDKQYLARLMFRCASATTNWNRIAS